MARALPDDAPISQRATYAFHHAASYSLQTYGAEDAEGRRPKGTQREVAEIVGSRSTNYSDAMRGRGSSIDRVQRWIAAWSQTSYPALRLVLDGDDVWVEVEGLDQVFGPEGRRPRLAGREAVDLDQVERARTPEEIALLLQRVLRLQRSLEARLLVAEP